MALKPVRRKYSKRLSNSSLTDSRDGVMAPSTPCLSNPRVIPLLLSPVLFVCVLILLNSWLDMGSSVGLDGVIDRIYSAEVVNEFPHDPNAFTQGLLYAGNDTLFESTGLNGHSSVRRVALVSGKVMDIHRMRSYDFGEGLTLLGDRLFQVTWLKKTGFIYDRSNLSKIKTFKHQMEDGWGLATDGKVLFGSDGSSTLYAIDPQTLKVVRKHTIKYKGHEVHNLNELEYVKGEVWANVWQTDCIARISGEDGVFLGWIYLPEMREGLIASGHTHIDVLNGIAWDQEQDRVFVTGKLWPKLYEIKVHPMQKPSSVDIESLCMAPRVHFGIFSGS